jgi:hypothetical protein
MSDTKTFDRETEVLKAKHESELSDLKQHADKMLRDFEKFNDVSSNRAIWELIQNACDLTTECEVAIDYTNGKFSFTHNGRPFTTNALGSLIKQVSGDKDGICEIPPVGKYGTGFLTTHSLARKFTINSILQTSNGSYIELKDFMIDRSAKKSEELREQIRLQKERVYEIISNGTTVENPPNKTTFTYLPETDQEKTYIAESYGDLEEYMPIVLTINNRLKKVNIIAANGQITAFELYSKELLPNNHDIRLYKTSINKNGTEIAKYSIEDPENGIEIILPVDKELNLFEFPPRVARLFLYYPLIGTEKFGMNFVINCKRFMPTEERNGIHLKSKNDQITDQEESNRQLMKKASELLFNFLESNILPIKNPLLYADIDFRRETDNPLLNEYFTGLQEMWVEKFKCLPIVDSKSEKKRPDEITFLCAELLQHPEHFKCIYYLFDKFYNDIPLESVARKWSLVIDRWKYKNATLITNKQLAEQIKKCRLSDFESDLLKRYYQYLIEVKEIGLFNEHPLIPNLEG